MERMEEAVAGADYEGLQHFIADSPWAAGPVMDHVAREVSRLLGGPSALAYIDETAFSKKGEKSVGVARQYNGRLGKVDNCQVAVFAALGRGDRAALAGVRLYLPEEWCADAARCQDAKSHLGLADYQIRGWRAWHHHMALVMLAMLFHLRERLVHAENYPLLS